MIDLKSIDTQRAALLVMHYQADVFSILADIIPRDLLGRTNQLINEWRKTGRPVVFANLCLGSNYESVHANNMLTVNISKSGYFRDTTPVSDLAITSNDKIYSCPRASVFHSNDLDKDLRAQGINTLVMAGIASSGVLFSSVSWASDEDYKIYLARECCYDPDTEAHEALFRTSFATRATIL